MSEQHIRKIIKSRSPRTSYINIPIDIVKELKLTNKDVFGIKSEDGVIKIRKVNLK
jgi:hypothetical protein